MERSRKRGEIKVRNIPNFFPFPPRRLEAAADEGAFKALAAEAVAAARAGKISDADLSAFKDAHKAHKAQWIASQPPAPVDDLPEPGSDG
jgi:hypothetical protein